VLGVIRHIPVSLLVVLHGRHIVVAGPATSSAGDRDPDEVTLLPVAGAALGDDHPDGQLTDGDGVPAGCIAQDRRVRLVGVEDRADLVEIEALHEVVDAILVVVGDHALAVDQGIFRHRFTKRLAVLHLMGDCRP